MKIVKCKSCGAPIVWIKTTNGRPMPCDAEAVNYQENYKGKDVIVTPEGKVIRGSVIKPDGGLLQPVIDGEGYISHFATCPYADKHRHPHQTPEAEAAKPKPAPTYYPPTYTADDLDYYADAHAGDEAAMRERRKW